MRLSPRKIRDLAGKLAVWIDARDDMEILKSRDALTLELAAAIRDELALEDDLDRDVERVLARYRSQIDAQTMDVALLRDKIKKQLARERGIVI
jgi:hypothetical protein